MNPVHGDNCHENVGATENAASQQDTGYHPPWRPAGSLEPALRHSALCGNRRHFSLVFGFRIQ